MVSRISPAALPPMARWVGNALLCSWGSTPADGVPSPHPWVHSDQYPLGFFDVGTNLCDQGVDRRKFLLRPQPLHEFQLHILAV
jgi:hypothetical protein